MHTKIELHLNCSRKTNFPHKLEKTKAYFCENSKAKIFATSLLSPVICSMSLLVFLPTLY